jgi:hypothetical protein
VRFSVRGSRRLRRVLATAGRIVLMKPQVDRGWDDEGLALSAGTSIPMGLEPGEVPPVPKGVRNGASRSYRPFASGLARIAIHGLIVGFVFFILLAVIILIALAWVMAPSRDFARSGSMEGLGEALTFLILFFLYARTVCRMPIEIDLDEEARIVRFHCLVGSRRVPAGAFISIRRGSRQDSHAVIRHEAGKVVLSYPFRDFRDFLERLKALNPSVEIKGF